MTGIPNKDEFIKQPIEEMNYIIQLVNVLKDEGKRANALFELSKKRETFSELAVFLWYSPGIMTIL